MSSRLGLTSISSNCTGTAIPTDFPEAVQSEREQACSLVDGTRDMKGDGSILLAVQLWEGRDWKAAFLPFTSMDNEAQGNPLTA